MKKIVAFCCVFTSLLCACNGPAVKTQQDGSNSFYYYPSKNLYYNIAKHQYIFSLDSGKTWDTLSSPVPAPAIEGERETIYSNSEEIWQENARHVDEYHGIVLNIINERSLRPPPPRVKKTSIKKSEPVTEDSVKKERKRPLKRFFEKLFGKKKDE
jgi:hypothetical protein